MSEPTGESRAPLEALAQEIEAATAGLTEAQRKYLAGRVRALAAQPPSGDAPDPDSPQWESCKVCGGDHWTSDHPSIAGEYGRLLAQRDRLIASGVDPADLELPLALSTDLAGDETTPPCGVIQACSRPSGHRGQHGGYRVRRVP